MHTILGKSGRVYAQIAEGDNKCWIMEGDNKGSNYLVIESEVGNMFWVTPQEPLIFGN